jgi:hypothetical protein
MIQNMWLRYVSHEGSVLFFSISIIILSNFGRQEQYTKISLSTCDLLHACNSQFVNCSVHVIHECVKIGYKWSNVW